MQVLISAKVARNFFTVTLYSFLIIFFFVTASVAECSTGNPPYDFGFDEPERQGVDPARLLELTRWIRTDPTPILSLLISRNGKIVYEMYTSKSKRDDADYLMSVTKSVTSALLGVAIDRHLVKDADSSISDNLPRRVFSRAGDFEKFKSVTIKDALGMSALDAQVAPHLKTPDGYRRLHEFVTSKNKLAFALEQPLLPRIGQDFQYTDITPMIAGGIIQYATKQSLLDFGKATLFNAMGFKNEDWMHQDQAGFDNAAYGLRLRPIDMQKFGILFLNEGCWEGQQLISRDWVTTSFTPWIKSSAYDRNPDYGWYWWKDNFIRGWTGSTANGWKGQRITIFPEKSIVVTMTSIIEDDSERQFYENIINWFVIPAIESKIQTNEPTGDVKKDLTRSLYDVLVNKTAIQKNTESRMVPSVTAKERHQEFHANSF